VASSSASEDYRIRLGWLVRALNPVDKRVLNVTREVTMSIRMNITMDDDLYARLKKEVPPKKLSAFILGAVRAKLRPDARTLNAAYQAASKEQWRAGVAEDWKYTD
jgi:Arc/MetJ family transcription regulator